MKKVLLSLMAVLASVGMYAQNNVGDYIYTSTGRFKVTQDVEIPQPVFGSTQWTGIDGLFNNYAADGDDDFNGIIANKENADENDKIYVSFPLEYGANYIFTFRFSGLNAGNSSIDPTVANYVDAWVSKQDDQGTKPTAEDVFKQQVGASFNFLADTWAEVSWSFAVTDTALQDAENICLNLVFAKLPVDTKIASNMQLVKVTEVYDIRPMQKRIDFVKKLMADPNFDTVDAAEMKGELEGAIEAIEAEIETEYDDPATGAETLDALNSFIENFLGVTSTDMKSSLSGIDFPNLAKFNNGDSNFPTYYANMRLSGGRWGHGTGAEYLNAGYQKGYTLPEHTVTFINANFPAGKYFISAEVRVANCVGNAWTYNFNLDKEGVTLFVGSNKYELPAITGREEYTTAYFVAEIPEGEDFSAGVYFPAFEENVGGAVNVRNVQIRAFNDVVKAIERKTAWNSFMTQWNAVVGARNAVIAKQTDANFPYAKDSLQNVLDEWDPIYNKFFNVWVDADGNDLRVATNEELTAFGAGTDMGYEYVEEESPAWAAKYALVRAYQYANNYVNNRNQIITDFNALIATAEATLNDDMNQEGDKDTFQEDINEAKGVIAGILATATDDTYETDSLTLATATDNLKAAMAAFLESVEMKPFIDIDFSNDFTAVNGDPEDPETVTGYVINGKAGQMAFAQTAIDLDNTTDVNGYQLGSKGLNEEALRVGNTAATVALNSEVSDDDVIRVQFDLWVGCLSGKSIYVDLRNANNERVAGFQVNRYNGNYAYNDFDNAEGTGMNPKSCMADTKKNVDNALYADTYKASFDLIIDYKANTVQGTTTGNKTTTGGVAVPLTKALEDNKISQFVLGSNYGTPGRRCWFDNLKIFKYKSSATGEDPVSINAVAGNTSNAAAGIYTISGAKVNALQKGINIVKTQNGEVKKVFIK